MNYKILIFLILFLNSCTNNFYNQSNEYSKSDLKFSNSGFALIYNENLFSNKLINKKMNDRDLIIFQKKLKKGTSVKVSNPLNNKSLIAQVGKNSIYPNFNNSVISKRIASELELSLEEKENFEKSIQSVKDLFRAAQKIDPSLK